MSPVSLLFPSVPILKLKFERAGLHIFYYNSFLTSHHSKMTLQEFSYF